MASDAAPPSYDSIFKDFHSTIGPNSSLKDVKAALLSTHLAHGQHIDAFVAPVKDTKLHLSPEQQVKYATSVMATMTSPEGTDILKKTVSAAIDAVKSTDQIFSSLHVKLVSIDGKYTNPRSGAFAPKLVAIQEDWKKVALKSKTQASQIAAYAERFAQIIMPLLDDKKLSKDDKLKALNTFIEKAESFRQISDDIIKGYTSVQNNFETLTGEFKNWAKDKIDDLNTQLKKAQDEMDTIVQNLAKKRQEMIGVGAGAAATLPITGVAAIFAGPFAPAVIVGGLVAAVALTATVVVLATQVNNLQDQQSRKKKEIDDLKKDIKDLQDVQAELIETGNKDLVTLQENILAMSQVWEKVRDNAVDIREKLTASKDDLELQDYFKEDVKLVIGIYKKLGSCLHSYATGMKDFE